MLFRSALTGELVAVAVEEAHQIGVVDPPAQRVLVPAQHARLGEEEARLTLDALGAGAVVADGVAAAGRAAPRRGAALVAAVADELGAVGVVGERDIAVGAALDVPAGAAIHTRPGEWVRYSTPGGAEYVAVCLPAFSPDTVHRDS